MADWAHRRGSVAGLSVARHSVWSSGPSLSGLIVLLVPEPQCRFHDFVSHIVYIILCMPSKHYHAAIPVRAQNRYHIFRKKCPSRFSSGKYFSWLIPVFTHALN